MDLGFGRAGEPRGAGEPREGRKQVKRDGAYEQPANNTQAYGNSPKGARKAPETDLG